MQHLQPFTQPAGTMPCLAFNLLAAVCGAFNTYSRAHEAVHGMLMNPSTSTDAALTECSLTKYDMCATFQLAMAFPALLT